MDNDNITPIRVTDSPLAIKVCGARNSTCVCIDAHLASDVGVTHRCHQCGYHWEVK